MQFINLWLLYSYACSVLRFGCTKYLQYWIFFSCQLFTLSHCNCNLCMDCARLHFHTNILNKGVTGVTCPGCEKLNPANLDDLHHALSLYATSVCSQIFVNYCAECSFVKFCILKFPSIVQAHFCQRRLRALREKTSRIQHNEGPEFQVVRLGMFTENLLQMQYCFQYTSNIAKRDDQMAHEIFMFRV